MTGLRTFSCTLAALVAMRSGANAQTAPAATPDHRAQAIAASFSKSKHVVREKRGIRKEKYRNVKSVVAVRTNPATYSGIYEDRDLGLSLQLTVNAGGKVEGTGYDSLDTEWGVKQHFTLRNARIDGALLTGAKVYANGVQEPLEGVFIDRTTRDNPADEGTSEFGLAVIGKAIRFSGFTTNRFFYRLQVSGGRE